MEETFNVGQTVWHRDSNEEFVVKAIDFDAGFVWCWRPNEKTYVTFADPRDLTSVDPKPAPQTITIDADKFEHLLNCMAQFDFSTGLADGVDVIHKAYHEARKLLREAKGVSSPPPESAIQLCPVCHGRPMMAGGDENHRVFCTTIGCILGPTHPTRIGAIRAWNSLCFDTGNKTSPNEEARLKFKVGDSVLVVGEVVEVDEEGCDIELPYRVEIEGEKTWFMEESIRRMTP